MIFPKTKKAKIILPTALLLTVVVAAGLFWPQSAHALIDISELFGKAIGWLLYAILVLFAKLLVAVIQMLVAVASYNDFTNATAVVKGWVITRDVCNMFFIGILLMMAFGTILKWETYRYNKMLGRLILMAFLINFSKFICGFFIDIFQVIMLTFVNAFSGVAAGTFANALGIKEMLQITLAGDQTYEFKDIIGSLLLALLLVTIALIVMIAITLVLLMRIIWLWVLIVLSPVAFLLKTWPGGGEKFASRWWGDFGKNLTGGPMLAFFLWLALTIMTTRGADQSLAQKELNVSPDAMSIEQPAVIESGSPQPGSATANKFYTTISEVSSSDRLLSYIISISLLIGALMMGQQMGVAGGSAISWAQNKTGGLLRKAATLGAAGLAGGAIGLGIASRIKPIRSLLGYGESRLHERTGIGLSPKRIWKGIQEAREKKTRDREIVGQGRAGQMLQKGGVLGTIGGMLGAPRDSAEAFLGWRGVFNRLPRSLMGGDTRVKGIQAEIDKENGKVEEIEKKGGFYTHDEHKKMQDEKKDKEGDMKALDEFINNKSNTLDPNSMSQELKKGFSAALMENIRRLPEMIKSWRDEAKTKDKPEEKSKLNERAMEAEKLHAELSKKYAPQIKISEDIDKEKQAIAEAIKMGGTDGNDRQKRAREKMTQLQGDLANSLTAPITLDPKWNFTEDWRGDMAEEHKKMQDEVKELDVKLATNPVSPEDKKSHEEEMKKIRDNISRLEDKKVGAMGPQAFYSLRARRLLEREEMNKLDTTNEDELIYMFKDALKNKDRIRANGVLMQSARVGHLNEILNATQYKEDRSVTAEEAAKGWEAKQKGLYFDSNQQGLTDFMKQIVMKQLGSPTQEALALQNDLSNMAENIDHWTFGQSVGVKNGRYRARDPHEQEARNMIEMAKRDPETIIRRSNRLGYGGERIDPKTGKRFHIVGGMGLALLMNNWQGILNNFPRNRYNKSAAQHLSSDANTIILKQLALTLDNNMKNAKKYKDLEKYGLLTEQQAFLKFIEELKLYAKRNADEIQEEAKELSDVIGSTKELYPDKFHNT
ncbi:MAG: hypothetical protein ABIH38_03180 [Patescibacteria group bacterium]